MLAKTSSELQAELQLFRRAYAGASQRAAAAWALVKQVQACRIWLPRNETLEHLASSIFHNGGYDAHERYSCIEEFQETLTEEVDEAWASRAVVDGQDNFVLQPFFAPTIEFLHELRIGYLHGCDPAELAALNVPAPGPVDTSSVSGVSLEELQSLVQFNHSRTLTLVNTMRHLETALSYLRSDIARGFKLGHGGLALQHDGEITGLVELLAQVVALPFEPAPASSFGTDASRTNPLRKLPATAQALAPLLG